MTEKVLDTEKEDDHLWLIKVPKFVGDAWKERHPSQRLGSIEVRSRSDARLILDERIIGTGKPNRFNIRFSDDYGSISVLSESPDGDASMKGTVSEKCDARPELGHSYRNIVRNRTLNADSGRLEARNMDMTTQKRKRNEMLKPIERKEKIKPRGSQWERRARIEEPLLRKRILAMFGKSEQRKLTYSEIQEKVEQPDKYLREVLGNIAVYEKEGPDRGKYSLRVNFAGTGIDRV